MRSKFSVLREDDSNESEDSLEDTERYQYTIPELLSYYDAAVAIPPPAKAQEFDVFVSTPQKPACKLFTPPKSEINSTIYLNPATIKAPPRRTQRQPQRSKKGADAAGAAGDDDAGVTMWCYKDPMDHVVGPYPSAMMRDWLDRKYIDASLLVRDVSSGEEFQEISRLFPDMSQAFVDRKGHAACGESQNEEDEDKERRQTTLFSFAAVDNDRLDFDDINM